MLKRRRLSSKNRLAAFAKAVREKADHMPYSRELDDMLRLADAAAHIDEWANSAGLQPPK